MLKFVKRIPLNEAILKVVPPVGPEVVKLTFSLLLVAVLDTAYIQ